MNISALVDRYSGRLPRYTSYPTAPHFHEGISQDTYANWLRAVPQAEDVSLYLHVPFCDRLCLYCGCNTAVVRDEVLRREYADCLIAELRMVAAQLGGRRRAAHIHWGGGTPTTLPPDAMLAVMVEIASLFRISSDTEIAIEIDPAFISSDRLDVLAKIGVNRASIGVQDLDPDVQAAIGRPQSFDQTMFCMEALRNIGVASINLDLIYGLPKQTLTGARLTALRILELRAERISVFGYAHVPWMKRHQQLIATSSLPDAYLRFAQMQAIGDILVLDGGYARVGLDHYAKPDDALVRCSNTGSLHRNFQGYSTDAAPTLIGLGASAIGSLLQGYIQNTATTGAYKAAIRGGRLATAHGLCPTADDRRRRAIIERIMCDLCVELCDIDAALVSADEFVPFIADGLLRWDGRQLIVTEAGRPFLRNIAALFDAYLPQQTEMPRHAAAI